MVPFDRVTTDLGARSWGVSAVEIRIAVEADRPRLRASSWSNECDRTLLTGRERVALDHGTAVRMTLIANDDEDLDRVDQTIW